MDLVNIVQGKICLLGGHDRAIDAVIVILNLFAPPDPLFDKVDVLEIALMDEHISGRDRK